MNNPIFKREDFVLCQALVPKGYPQSQTHVGVFPCNGRVYLSSSPFPVRKYSKLHNLCRVVLSKISQGRIVDLFEEEGYENPLLYRGEEGVSEPTEFELLTPSPLMDRPLPTFGYPCYNSDPDLFIEGETFHVLNRVNIRKSKVEVKGEYIQQIYHITGVVEGSRFKMISSDILKEFDNPDIVSPCLTKFNDTYFLFTLNTRAALDGTSFDGLYYYTGKTIDCLKCESKGVFVKTNIEKFLPWHMSVFSYGDSLYAIIVCAELGNPHKLYQRLGKFDLENNSLHIFDNKLSDYCSYRGAAYVDDNGRFVLYNATLQDIVPGSISVDGRDIIKASCMFSDLLAKIGS